MADQFDNPGTATAIDLGELNGRLLLIKPSRVEVGVSTVLGEKDATVADVHVLDGPDPGEVLGEVFIWPRVLQNLVCTDPRHFGRTRRAGLFPGGCDGAQPLFAVADGVHGVRLVRCRNQRDRVG